MNAGKILLTHFSQRYPKIPTIDDNMMAERVSLAFDMMSVTLKDLRDLPSLLPTLHHLFNEEEEEEEDD